MSLYTKLCSGLLFPVHERLKGHASVALRRRLEQSQWWSREQLDAFQAERLRAFLRRACDKVPYYRDVFERAGISPSDIQSSRDLRKLPFLDKGTIRANVDRIKARGAVGLTRYNTGGSSGEPLIFYLDKTRKSHDVAAKWRATRWWGVDIGDQELVVWGSPIELKSQDHARFVRDRILRSHLLPAFEMSAANLDRFVSIIRRMRPKMLFGYPSCLSLIASHALERGIPMTDLGIRVAFVTSEKLYEEQRSLITQCFGCPVANGYGARDAGFIAHECPSGSLHVSAEDIIVETVRPDGTPTSAGEAGEIVVTNMATPDFPFVRYMTGDVGVLSSTACACGRGLPVLHEVQGRTTDFVVGSDGTVMHGLALIYTVRDLPGVECFKIVQESLACTQVQLVTNHLFDVESELRIIREFKARLGRSVEIHITHVPEIPPEKSGKFRYVTSKVARSVGAELAANA